MIQANELRSGNWLKFNHDNQFEATVADMHVDRILLGFIPETELIASYMINGFGAEMVYPIPLTPEILEKCGFVIDGAGKWERKYTRQYDDPGAGFWLWQFKGGPEYCFGVESKDGLSSVAINNIYFLHELQNAWHSITRTELNYKP